MKKSYILIIVGRNDNRDNILVSDKKYKIVNYLKELKYCYSKKFKRYIDKTNQSYCEYIVEKIKIL